MVPGPADTLLALAGVAACAKVAPPPGGPEDLVAPAIVAEGVRPAPGAGGVDSTEAVIIPFSERPDRRSVMRALTIWPPVDFRDVVWDADTLRLIPDPAWAAGRNTILRISRGAEDRRGNALESAFQLRFTTKSPPDSGEIAGRVWAGKEWDRARPLVLFAIEAADVADSLDLEEAPPHAVTEATREGSYRLPGLDTARAWRVAALIDRDDDAAPGGRGEAHALSPETVRFEPGAREAKVSDFLVGTLDSLGTITGEIAADSGAVAFAVARGETGGEGTEATYRSDAIPGGGAFSIEVPTRHSYRVSAFVDADGDSLAGESEVSLEREDPVSLEFTTTVRDLRFDLSTPEEEESLELERAPESAAADDGDGGATDPAKEESAATPDEEGEEE